MINAKAHLEPEKSSPRTATIVQLAQKRVVLSALAGCVSLFAAQGYAADYDGTGYNVYDYQQNDWPNLVEEKVYINQDKTVAQGAHLTGSLSNNSNAEEAYWYTSDAEGLVGEGNGWATIKGGADDGLIHDITFGVYGSYFEDVIFSALPVNQQQIDLVITATFSDGTTETSDQIVTANGLDNWLVLANAGYLFKEVNIQSTSGINFHQCDSEVEDCSTDGGATQTKQWQVSGIQPVPIPAAAWLFGSGLIGLAGLARRKKSVTS